jgi:flagellar assembly protein FliH
MNLSRSVIKAEEIRLVGKMRPLSIDFAVAAFGLDAPQESRKKAGCRSAGVGREEEITRAKTEAFALGHAEGMKKGQELCKKKYSSAVAAANEVAKELGLLRRKIFEDAEGQMLDLAFAIAAKVIHQEVSINDDVIVGVLREAIQNIVERDGLKIRLNPRDYHYIMEMKPDFLPSLVGAKNVSVEEDASVSRGGAVIETAFGEVDARLDRQFAEIRAAMQRDGEI